MCSSEQGGIHSSCFSPHVLIHFRFTYQKKEAASGTAAGALLQPQIQPQHQTGQEETPFPPEDNTGIHIVLWPGSSKPAQTSYLMCQPGQGPGGAAPVHFCWVKTLFLWSLPLLHDGKQEESSSNRRGQALFCGVQ